MFQCGHCNNQVSSNAKNCIYCGAIFENNGAPKLQNPIDEIPKKNFLKYLYLAIITGCSLGLFYMILNFLDTQNTTSTATNTTNNIRLADTAIPIPKPIIKPKQPIAATPKFVDTNSIVTNTTNTNTEDATNNRLLNILTNYFTNDNLQNSDAMLNSMLFPLTRYYNDYNITAQQLNSLLQKYWTEKVSYHKIEIESSLAKIEKNIDGYTVTTPALYEWEPKTGNTARKNLSLNLQIIFNQNFEITSIYSTTSN